MIETPEYAARQQEHTNSEPPIEVYAPKLVKLLELAADFGFHHPPDPTHHRSVGWTSVARRERFKEALNRLAAAEASALASEFLAPLVRGGVVGVKIAGVVCRFKVDVADFEGWGVFKADSASTARLVRPARLAERRQYLDLFPLLRLIVCLRAGSHWLAITANRADSRFQIEGMIPVRLIEEAQLFDVVQARFDGAQAWFDGPEPRFDPSRASYLREALAAMVTPDDLSRPGLTAEERSAYAMNYMPRLRAQMQAQRDRVEERIRAALIHAGATFRDYQDRGDVYRVTYEIDGRRHVSVVDRNDLSVQAAGICLSGDDRRFDLQSLVGVLREASETGQVAPVYVED
jgi:hypothetical protein